MTILLVPTFALPSWSQTTTFEGTTYTLQFDYNQRAASFYMSIADASGVDIDNGVKLTVGPFLLEKCKDIRRPPGDLLVISSTANVSPAGLNDLLPGSGRCQLVYVTSDWLAAIEAGQGASLAAQIAQGSTASPASSYGQPP